MNHPPYHLRTNKAIDRLLFVEAIHWWATPQDLSKYTYYSFGGPYMEDFRLLHENFPLMKMVSIEQEKEIWKRQKFHLPFSHVELLNTNLKTFLTQYEPQGKKSIFWLDFTGLRYSHFDTFMSLLGKVSPKSIIKITLECKPSRFTDKPGKTEKADEFIREYGYLLPHGFNGVPAKNADFAMLLQDMAQIASQHALHPGIGFIFQPLCSFFYRDTVPMITLTGMVCRKSEESSVQTKFSKWRFANLKWSNPREINVPYLSTKERLAFQSHLPGKNVSKKKLFDILGYNIGEDKQTTVNQLRQYAEFCRYYPHFLKTIP